MESRLLHAFIATHREEIISRTREKLAKRQLPSASEVEIEYGVPRFLDELNMRLASELEHEEVQIGASATLHGGELLAMGFTIGQVVHDYGNICQAITELAVELSWQISNEDFHTLNLCLDIAIAEAVSEYARRRERDIVGSSEERVAIFAHELRNQLNTATLAYEAVRRGNVGVGGSTGALLGKSLASLRTLVSRSLAEIRLEVGQPQRERIRVANLLEEIEIVAATASATTRGIQLVIEPVAPDLAVDGDLQILISILTNLVQNALKFTRPNTRVVVRTLATDERVVIEVEDECGGLPPGKEEELFQPYTQLGADRSGLGLGLTICRRGARAIGGELRARSLVEKGCVFALELRRSRSGASSVSV